MPGPSTSSALALHEGERLLSASEAIIKGVLEAELEISLIAGPRRGALAGVLETAMAAPNAAVLRLHNTRTIATPDAARGITLCTQAARVGRASMALIPNDELDESIAAIAGAMSEPFDRGGAMGIILEDSPGLAPFSCPRQTARRLNLPCIEPANLSQLRTAMDVVLRLGRAGRCPVGVVVHTSIFRSAQTLEMLPNRVQVSVDGALARRKRLRAPRVAESGGALRMARRLELNRVRAIPNPGERSSIGFIVIGPAEGALLHLTSTLGLFGRVPVLQLGLIHPIDEPAVERLLARCQQVMVLEPRPGATESDILRVAEAMRHRGEWAAAVWGRLIPPGVDAAQNSFDSEDDLHPSILVRKISHLLHDIRPTSQLAARLIPEPPTTGVAVPPRDAETGSTGALRLLRRILTDVDQWLRDRTPAEGEDPVPRALAIGGTEAVGVKGRIVTVEMWSHHDFERDGVAAVVQAARDDRPWMLIVFESMSDRIGDMERFVRGATPADRADRVKIETAGLADRVALRDLIREAALAERVTVIIAQDGPPAQYDVAAIERALEEIDRLGFEPRQRLVRAADEVCDLRPSAAIVDLEGFGPTAADPLRTEFTRDEFSKRVGAGFRWRIQPLLEEVEVFRTRPPLRAWPTGTGGRVTAPQPIHASQPQWRVHLAGFRDEAPGLAAAVLCEAGRLMGHHVRTIHDDTPIGGGYRAWTQILFTHPKPGAPPSDLPARIPYGEADLLLGIDAMETLRAIGPDPTLRVAFKPQTYAVVNVGRVTSTTTDPAAGHAQLNILPAIVAVTNDDSRVLADVSAACREWFHTDRVTDMALLGAAYQLGLIPVSQEAIEGALAAMESRGFGRCREAFDFGRQLSAEPGLFVSRESAPDTEVQRVAKRMAMSLSRRAWSSSKRARVFARLVQASLEAMPGLAETDPGRTARRDFVIACHRCVTWGGYEHARRYADLIVSLYQRDRGDRGRTLTRNAILPLADAMLIRDSIYVAAMARSAEQRRELRLRLNIKSARGDRVERRYLTRFEIVAFDRRFRADVRTSDWPARAVAAVRRFIPKAWRGTQRERQFRDFVVDLIQRAGAEAVTDYDRWCDHLSRLHNQAAENRLRGMAIAELKMLVGV